MGGRGRSFLEEDKGQDNIIRARGLEMSYLNGREERNYMLTFGDDVVFEEELKRRLGSGRSSSFAQVGDSISRHSGVGGDKGHIFDSWYGPGKLIKKSTTV